MRTAINMYKEGMKTSFASRMAYRGDYFMSMIVTLTVELIAPLVVLLIYRTGASFPGWNLYEVLLIQAIFLLSKGIATATFFGMIFNTLARVREGTFDLLMIKPASPLYLSIVTGLDGGIGKLFGGLAMFVFALANLPKPSMMQFVQFLLLLVLSLVMMFSLAVIMSGSLFKWVGNSRLFEVFDCLTYFGLYPKTIFSKAFQNIVGFVIPVAMLGFFPATVLLGRPSVEILYGAISCLAFLGLSLMYYKFMLRQYTSAGG